MILGCRGDPAAVQSLLGKGYSMAKGKTGPLGRQVKMLNDSLTQITDHPTYPVWARLIQLMSSLCSIVDEIIIAIRGDGNGSYGLLDRTTKVESTVESIANDMSEVKSMLMVVLGVNEKGEVSKPNHGDHPNRRAEDQLTMSDKITKYIIDRILPQLIVWVIVGFLAFQIALNNRLIVIPNP